MKLRIIWSSFENWACEMKYGQDLEVILCHLTSLPGVGEGRIFQSTVACSGIVRVFLVVQWWVIAYELFAFHTLCYNIVAVTVHFPISSLLPVNRSYLNPWSLPFVLPVLLSSPMQGRDRKGGSEWTAHSLECVSGNTKLRNTIPEP